MEEKPATDCSDRRYRDFGGFCTIAGLGYAPCFKQKKDGTLACNMGAPDVEGTHQKAREKRIRQIKKCVKTGKPIIQY